jgi:hypothetical protein
MELLKKRKRKEKNGAKKREEIAPWSQIFKHFQRKGTTKIRSPIQDYC